jgi:hypothetical protein
MYRPLVTLFILMTGLSCLGCQQAAPEPKVDMAAMQEAVLKKTQELYLIHLKLDTAAADITAAELKANSGECADAEYLASDAYRNITKADEDLLQLGRDLQALFNLDVRAANRN